MSQILFNQEAKETLRRGVNIVADAVGSTMGACGRTAVISRLPFFNGTHFQSIPPIVSKDGWTLCTSITLDDELENIGSSLLKEASTKTMKQSGDGTTSTCVLAQSIINEGLKQISAGYSPQQIKSGIDKSVNNVWGSLKAMSDPINESNEKIRNVATISANNDTVIGNLIADAYLKMGTNGLLLIEESGTLNTVIEVTEGAEIQRGYISPEFSNNKEKMTFNGDDAYILVCDYTLSSVIKDLAPLFSQMEQAGIITKPIVIIAQDYEGEVFGTILKNVKQKTLNCCLSKVPSSYRSEGMEDVAVLTGATVISDREGLKMENALLSHLGRARNIVVSENKTTIIGGYGDAKKIEEHKQAIKVQMEDMKDEGLKEVWKLRLGRLSGSVGIIKVGGATDIEIKEISDRVEDAKRSVESAIEEGVVVGGGVALIRCIDSLNNLELSGDEKIGRDIIVKACKAPLLKMLENAGEDSSIVKEVYNNTNKNFGYNMKTKQFQDLFENGVMDSTKVVRSALQNAASVACGILTSGCLIVERKVK